MLTQTSEYALRAMVYLAKKGEGVYCGVKEIADATEVPYNYLAKILQLLALEKVLQSQKGFGGGFRIATSLTGITLLQVVDPLENISKFRQCVLGQRECNDQVACPLHDAWKRISETYLGSLEKTTLQDLADFRVKTEPLESSGFESGTDLPPDELEKPAVGMDFIRHDTANSELPRSRASS